MANPLKVSPVDVDFVWFSTAYGRWRLDTTFWRCFCIDISIAESLMCHFCGNGEMTSVPHEVLKNKELWYVVDKKVRSKKSSN